MYVDRRSFLVGAAGAAVAAMPNVAHADPVCDKLPMPETEDLRILVIGDAGTGARPQWLVADAVRALHADEPFSCALSLGDNLYDYGPWADNDAQFRAKFEDPNHSLDFPWLMVQGNHDNSAIIPGDGAWLLRGDHEVAYHSRSARWFMPSRYYSVPIPEVRPIVEFFVLDLNPLATYQPPPVVPYWAPGGMFMTEQAAWLDRAIDHSPAKWKIACTHHPYLSNGPHGNAGEYEGSPFEAINGRHVKDFFETHVLGRCQFILSGHDHTLQVLDPNTASRGTRQIVSGAGAKTAHGAAPGANPALFQNYTDVGFMVLDLCPNSAEVGVFTVDLGNGQLANVFRRRST
ncbi:metallophosphoesterase [Nocardia sp. NPDC051570]|uniref:metallophosphoesterase n=1 Tax=Nocardia sp. NPDC051570 TaxID=3364324 RepID=UPI003792739B